LKSILTRDEIWNMVKLDILMTDLYNKVAAYLLKLIKTFDISKNLKILREYLLLGDSEIFFHFTSMAEQVINSPLNDFTENELNSIFQEILSDRIQQDDSINRLKFKIVETQKNENTYLNLWPSVYLNYKLDFPLSLLFDDEAIENYSKIFQFLFSIIRAKIAVRDIWQYRKHLSVRALVLRASMDLLIYNLTYYYQLNVVETQYFNLQNSIDSMNDFIEMKELHDNYLKSILQQTFLTQPKFWQCLDQIFKLCEEYGYLVKRDIDLLEKEEEISKIKLKYDRQINFLKIILNGLKYHSIYSSLLSLFETTEINK